MWTVNKHHQAQASASQQAGREIQKGCTLKKPTLCWVRFLSVPIKGGKKVLLHGTMFLSCDYTKIAKGEALLLRTESEER
jgi:hypothetical protein